MGWVDYRGVYMFKANPYLACFHNKSTNLNLHNPQKMGKGKGIEQSMRFNGAIEIIEENWRAILLLCIRYFIKETNLLLM